MRELDDLFAALAGSAFRRSCLAKWHDIPRGADLTDEQQAHVIAVLGRWLEGEVR